MKNNKNLAKPILAVALAASFFASPLNVNQVEAAKNWYKAVASEDQSDYTDSTMGFGTTTYSRYNGKYQQGGADVKVSRLVKCKTKKNYVQVGTDLAGGYYICYDGDLTRDMRGRKIKGTAYKTTVKKGYYANMVEGTFYSKKYYISCKGYIQRKNMNSKTATWGVAGSYRPGSDCSNWETIYINGKISKDGTVTVTECGGKVTSSMKKRVAAKIKELWLNKVDYPEFNQYGTSIKKDKNAVIVEE